MTRQAQALVVALQRCWAADVLLAPLAHRFLKLSRVGRMLGQRGVGREGASPTTEAGKELREWAKGGGKNK